LTNAEKDQCVSFLGAIMCVINMESFQKVLAM